MDRGEGEQVLVGRKVSSRQCPGYRHVARAHAGKRWQEPPHAGKDEHKHQHKRFSLRSACELLACRLGYSVSVFRCVGLTATFAGHHRLGLVIDVSNDAAASTFQRGFLGK